jgi:capsular polysaccharide export protein
MVIFSDIESFRGKRVLLLQGPVGPFFARLASDLTAAGAEVHKVNFNAGDALFYRVNAVSFKGTPAEWPRFFDDLISKHRIDTLLFFGDCRSVHVAAKAIAAQRGLHIGVFEEGYLRPRHITLESSGVNGYSSMPRSPLVYLNQPEWPDVPERDAGNTYWPMVWWAFCYFTVGALGKPWFPHTRHHRRLSVLEALPWIRSVWRHHWYQWKERGALDQLHREKSGHYFVVPLQVHNDSQIDHHSPFKDVPSFIDEVMRSFARSGPQETALVIKHHPMDRGYTDYSRHIARKARALGIEDRCLYLHDLHLPTMLDQARGVVVVNSTVGLQALRHGTPTKAMGAAVYNMQGLCYQGSLDAFWADAPGARPDPTLLRRFVRHLKNVNQINGSFYRVMPGGRGKTGLVWASSRQASPALQPTSSPATQLATNRRTGTG